jgi:hypothetical protein
VYCVRIRGIRVGFAVAFVHQTAKIENVLTRHIRKL